MYKYLIPVLILILLIVLIITTKSSFKCNTTPGGDISYRTYPSGNLPINYPELNEYEKNEYLRKFIKNKE